MFFPEIPASSDANENFRLPMHPSLSEGFLNASPYIPASLLVADHRVVSKRRRYVGMAEDALQRLRVHLVFRNQYRRKRSSDYVRRDVLQSVLVAQGGEVAGYRVREYRSLGVGIESEHEFAVACSVAASICNHYGYKGAAVALSVASCALSFGAGVATLASYTTATSAVKVAGATYGTTAKPAVITVVRGATYLVII